MGLICFAASFFICRDQLSATATIFGFSIVALTFGLFVLSAVMPHSILFRFKSVITKNLATLSYSLYLSHKGIIHITQLFLKGSGIAGNSEWMFLICISSCLGGALLMRVFIEKPALKLRNRIIARKSGVMK
jgi:peptidoglycan/LPS O-acetylase OafA/YrhL